MPFIHGYIRVSTDDQADSGLSLDAHRDEIRREWEYSWKPKGLAFGRVYEDPAVSGAKPLATRKGGYQLSTDLEDGDVVVIPRLDRGFRNTIDLLTTIKAWRERGIRVVFLDLRIDSMTDVGEMVIGIMGVVAQFERSQIRSRIKTAMAEKKRRGHRFGRLPFGCKMGGVRGQKNRRPVVVPDDFAIGRKIIQWKMEGHTFESICLHLMRSGVERPQGKPKSKVTLLTKKVWSPMAVWRAYKGTLKVLRWIEDGEVDVPEGFTKR